MEVILSENPVKTTAKLVSDALHAYSGTPLLLMISGGSWHRVLEYVDTAQLGSWCTLTCLDERFSFDSESNNFKALHGLNFFKKAVVQRVQMISTLIREDDTITSVKNRFEQELQAWHKAHQDGKVLALIGIGDDGHIAGIFPELLDTEVKNMDWVQSYTVTKSDVTYPQRITVSEYFLTNMVNQAIVYASGDDKKEIISKLLVEGRALSAPARILHAMPQVTLCTDKY